MASKAILRAAALGALHADFVSVRKDPMKWLMSNELEAVASNDGVDVTDEHEWDAYCAGLFLKLLPKASRGAIAQIVNET